jgi:hypothetical protein
MRETPMRETPMRDRSMRNRPMRNVRFTVAAVVWCVLWAGADQVQAQMFGSRSVGRPLARRPGPGALEEQADVGTLQGNERYLRQNRTALDFVGRDIAEMPRFLGLLQARTRGLIPASTQGLTRRVDRSDSINQPLLPARRGTMYPPRLDLTLEMFLSPDSTVAGQQALETLVRSPQLAGTSRIEVLVAGRTAILRGEVPSAADRERAEILLTFEPGISAIQNELQVNPQLQLTEDSLAALREQQTPSVRWETMSHGSRSN